MKFSNLLQEVLYFHPDTKMKKKIINAGTVFLFGIVFLSMVSAVCCERLDGDGNWCQNVVDTGSCDSDYRVLETSCDQTSFCTLGTCVNEVEGECIEGVPQSVCDEEYSGYWEMSDREDIPSCQLGCCTFGNNAIFVTATACTYQASCSGIPTEFDSSINDEATCILQATGDEEGACVYDVSEGRTECGRTTRQSCMDISEDATFYEGKLCSAPELGVTCGPTDETTCYQYDVHFVDTCGNIANIYDADYAQEGESDYWEYWSEIKESAPCDDGSGNSNSETCGDCEYYLGSTCGNYQSGPTGTPRPDEGDNICISLDCGSYDTDGDGDISESEQNYKHGEKWCGLSPSVSDVEVVDESYLNAEVDVSTENLPGSRYVTLECRNGEVLTTECDGYRNEVCAEDFYDSNEDGELDVGEYRTASCIVNKWQDCVYQTTKESCEDSFNRDCTWIVGHSFLDEEGDFLAEDEEENSPAACVPKFAPGLNFWEFINETDDAPDTTNCEIASYACEVKYESGIFGGDPEGRMNKCVKNCYCIPGYEDGDANRKYERDKPDWHPDSYEEWIDSLNLVCTSLGDCGIKENYIGEEGALTNEEVIDSSDYER